MDVRDNGSSSLRGQRERIGHDLATAYPEREDHLVRHLAERELSYEGQRLLDARSRMGGTEFHRLLAFELKRVDRDDPLGAGQLGALHGVDADAADTDDDDRVTGFGLGGVD